MARPSCSARQCASAGSGLRRAKSCVCLSVIPPTAFGAVAPPPASAPPAASTASPIAAVGAVWQLVASMSRHRSKLQRGRTSWATIPCGNAGPQGFGSSQREELGAASCRAQRLERGPSFTSDRLLTDAGCNSTPRVSFLALTSQPLGTQDDSRGRGWRAAARDSRRLPRARLARPGTAAVGAAKVWPGTAAVGAAKVWPGTAAVGAAKVWPGTAAIGAAKAWRRDPSVCFMSSYSVRS